MMGDSKPPLNIYSMFIVRELYVKMSPLDFDVLMNNFNALLCQNHPDKAQELINKTLEEYGI